jgi:hypothetical protein
MADLAVTFHWVPASMDSMAVGELMQWRERARLRTTPDGG